MKSYLAASRPLRYIPSCGKCHGRPSARAFQFSTRDYSCFLITHAHLDHVNGLVISAGSLAGPRKRVYALKQTLEDLESIFSDRIWPNLASWDEEDDEHKLLYCMYESRFFTYLCPDFSYIMN